MLKTGCPLRVKRSSDTRCFTCCKLLKVSSIPTKTSCSGTSIMTLRNDWRGCLKGYSSHKLTYLAITWFGWYGNIMRPVSTSRGHILFSVGGKNFPNRAPVTRTTYLTCKNFCSSFYDNLFVKSYCRNAR